MRHIFVPEELMPLHLVDVEDAASSYIHEVPQDDDFLFHAYHNDVTSLLARVDEAFTVAWGAHDRYSAALARLYQADLHYRQGCWGMALQSVQRANHWLKQDVTRVARYNEAVAAYFEGLLHYVLHSDEEAYRCFQRARRLLAKGLDISDYVGRERVYDNCETLVKWMEQLRYLRKDSEPGANVVILSIYSYVKSDFLIRGRPVAFPLEWFEVPRRVLPHVTNQRSDRGNGEVEIHLVEPGRMLLIDLDGGAHYFALQLSGSKEDVLADEVNGQEGDVVIYERRPPRSDVRAQEGPFVRLSGGRIVFLMGSHRRPFEGVPRLRLRFSQVNGAT